MVDQTYGSELISKFDNVVAGIDRGTFMCDKGEKDGAEEHSGVRS